MSDKAYNPQPLDTSSVVLEDEIIKLGNLLAENAHDAWACREIGRGFHYGTAKDDNARTHPFLAPYSQLPDEKQNNYRKAALDTIKSLLALGYRIHCPKGASTIVSVKDIEDEYQRILVKLKNPFLSLAGLRQLWEDRLPLIWGRHVDSYRLAVNSALKFGEGFLAFDIAEEGLQAFRDDLRLLQLQALALARTGATRRANAILEKLRLSGHQDEETLGILARTHKDFWSLATDPEEKREHLRLSFELYTESYRRNGGYYSAINAATMGLVAGEKDSARELARDVSNICERNLSRLSEDSGERYWLEATLAEAALIQADYAKAEEYYHKAAAQPGISSVVLSRTRSQARMLLEHSGENPTRLDHCFELPRIAVFSGHMFDRPGRFPPRFPRSLEGRVRDEIRRRLTDLDVQISYSSLACGADQIFTECLLDLGGEINIVLPFEQEDFKKASVDIHPGTDWVERFENVARNAATLTVLNERGDPEDGTAYDYCNLALSGLALLKSRVLGMDVVPIVVWDTRKGDGIGGTQSFVKFWEKRLPDSVQIISLKDLVESMEISEPEEIKEAPPAWADDRAAPAASRPDTSYPQELKAMLFADVVGYTKLTERQIPLFVDHFLGAASKLMDNMKNPPVHQNTWGDAICCVFNEVTDAGIFALKLRDLVGGTDWSEWGLPPDLSIRIALHAGPVFPCYDPVLKRHIYNGSHVNRTARIEPIAEEGQVYASEAFSAIAAANGVAEFKCDYVGTKQLAKKYGAIPVFLVREST